MIALVGAKIKHVRPYLAIYGDPGKIESKANSGSLGSLLPLICAVSWNTAFQYGLKYGHVREGKLHSYIAWKKIQVHLVQKLKKSG